jgi:Tol biopolymer transport system component
LCLFNSTTQAQNIIEKSGDQLKLFNAQQEFYKQDYIKSLNLYKEVLVNKPKDAEIIFHIGECNYMLGDFAMAKDHFLKSVSIDSKAAPDAHLYLGRMYLTAASLDSAGKELDTYRLLISGKDAKIKDSDVDLYIGMVKTAKEQMAKPIDVKIIQMGPNINSEYDDKRPSVTADGKTMVFTSRRPEGKAQVDVEGDNKPFDHIYMSTWNDTTKTWNPAEFMAGTVNGKGHNACSSITQDGKQIFIYRNNNDDAIGGEIFVSKVSTSGKWGMPKIMEKPINSTYFEDGACLSADGNTMFFISERPQEMKAPKGSQKGYGKADIWMSKRKSKTEWGIPENMGPEINTPYDEGGIFIHPDGKTLFFCSEGHNSMGGLDIFKTTLVNGKWTKPVNLGYPINTVNNETSFNLSVDGKTGYVSSDRPNGLGERDIYKVDLTNYDILGGGARVDPNAPKLSILKGTVFTGESGNPLQADVVLYDEAGAEVGRTLSTEDGNYFITLDGGKNYEVKIEVKGCKPIDEKFKLEKGQKETFVLVKHFLVYKK